MEFKGKIVDRIYDFNVYKDNGKVYIRSSKLFEEVKSIIRVKGMLIFNNKFYIEEVYDKLVIEYLENECGMTRAESVHKEVNKALKLFVNISSLPLLTLCVFLFAIFHNGITGVIVISTLMIAMLVYFTLDDIVNSRSLFKHDDTYYLHRYKNICIFNLDNIHSMNSEKDYVKLQGDIIMLLDDNSIVNVEDVEIENAYKGEFGL